MTELLAAGGCYNHMRFALDESGGATRNWRGAKDTNQDFGTQEQLILAVNLDGDDMNIATSATFKIQWRNVTDAGSWTDLGTTGDIRYASSSSQMSDQTALVSAELDDSSLTNCSGKGWSNYDSLSREYVNRGSVTVTVDDDLLHEQHWAIDISNADPDDQYEFRITQSDSTVIGTGTGKVTVKTPLDLIAESRDDEDNLVVSCPVQLFKKISATELEYVSSGTTDGTTGLYTFTVLGTDYYRILYLKALSPDQWDLSDEVQGA